MQQFYRNGKQLEWDSENPVITCLMSVYNGQTYLREAMDSILDQTYSNFEFLIINDGSTDDSVSIIESYDDPRIRLIHNKENIGLTKSLNKGIDLARGEFIARMDADDVSLKERFERQFTILKEKNVDFTGSAFILLTVGKRVLINCQYKYPNIINLIRNTSPHTSYFYKKKINNETIKYDEYYKYSQDFELYSRLILKSYKYFYCESPLVIVRNTNSQLSKVFRREQEMYCGLIVIRNIELLISMKLITDFNDGAIISGYYSSRITNTKKININLKIMLIILYLILKLKFKYAYTFYELLKEKR